jgi:serine protease AprX
MTSLVGSVDRIRWMAALAASAVLALMVGAALHSWQPPALQSVAAAAPTPSGSSAVLDPRLGRIAAAHPRQKVSAIVQFKAGVSPDRARWDVSRVSGQVFSELHIINALAVKLTAQRARWLAADRDVHSISLNATIKTEGRPARGHLGKLGKPEHLRTGSLQTTYDQSLNVTGLWRDGFNGSGVGVAVIDTGIDGGLPDFRGDDGASRVIASTVVNPDATTADDLYGHGTHVAGLLAGDGRRLAPSDPLYNRYIGTAPRADLVSIKVSDDAGNTTLIDVIDGLQFAVDFKDVYGIRVVNLSLNSTQAQSYRDDPLDAAAEAAWFAGLVVVTAAGNRADAPDAVSYAPGNDPFVITVGAVDDQGTKFTGDDVTASWSSRGVTQDGFAKPDVLAPGAHMVAPLAGDSAFAQLCPACVVDGRYFKIGGTSMASPVVAGIAADLISAHPRWTPDMVKQALVGNLRPVAGAGGEVAADLALNGRLASVDVNQGAAPSTLLDPATLAIDYTRASWRQATWSDAGDLLRAGWARASWKCEICGGGADADTTRASWKRASWRASWSSFFGSSPADFGELSGGDSGTTRRPAGASGNRAR